MLPRHVLHLSSDVFNAQCACLGGQIAEVAAKVSEFVPDLKWYIADVEYVGLPLFERSPTPFVVGDVDAFVRFSMRVDQFTSGVFVGVPAHIAAPQFREGGLWTEDEDASDLGDAVVEIRAFDWSYVSVAFMDNALFTFMNAEFTTR